jgi:hypothetical protein
MTNSTPPIPEQLTLPSGGMVWFRDVETLTGKDVKTYRRAIGGAGSRGEATVTGSEVLAQILVTRWELPTLPGLPLPTDDEKITDLLNWRDLLALEDAMAPVAGLFNGNGSTD